MLLGADNRPTVTQGFRRPTGRLSHPMGWRWKKEEGRMVPLIRTSGAASLWVYLSDRALPTKRPQ